MLNIHSLLNPATDGDRYRVQYQAQAATPPLTPAFTTHAFSPYGSPLAHRSPTPSLSKRQKLVKDAAVFTRGEINGRVHYPPFECTEDASYLNPQQRQELRQQHQNFKIFPFGNAADGRIADFPRHIPYSSEKKGFLNKTGRDALDGKMDRIHKPWARWLIKLRQYSSTSSRCQMSQARSGQSCGTTTSGSSELLLSSRLASTQRYHRFRAAVSADTLLADRYQTTPAKALTTNAGLKDLSHSITGGALAAQGYWVPYACARAICLTFCYPIRWALTPVFGPSFIKDCLNPDHPGFGRFKIDPEVVRYAAREADGWNAENIDNAGGPVNHHGAINAPRSHPEQRGTGPYLRPRLNGVNFRMDSPFASDSEISERQYTYSSQVVESGSISPRSTTPIGQSPAWTSINAAQYPASLPYPMPHMGGPLSGSLLNEPRYSPTASWRAADGAAPQPLAPPPRSMPAVEQSTKRRRSSKDQAGGAESDRRSSSSSESDEVDIPLSSKSKSSSSKRTSGRVQSKRAKASEADTRKFTAEDAQAAQWLLTLSERDARLARGPNQLTQLTGQKRDQKGA